MHPFLLSHRQPDRPPIPLAFGTCLSVLLLSCSHTFGIRPLMAAVCATCLSLSTSGLLHIYRTCNHRTLFEPKPWTKRLSFYAARHGMLVKSLSHTNKTKIPLLPYPSHPRSCSTSLAAYQELNLTPTHTGKPQRVPSHGRAPHLIAGRSKQSNLAVPIQPIPNATQVTVP